MLYYTRISRTESQSSLLERFVAYRKQRKNRTQQSSSSSSSCGTQTPSALPRKKVAFTEDEVKLLLSHREEQIRAEYDKILQERLQEQFNQFAQFNQDYISRQYKQTYVAVFSHLLTYCCCLLSCWLVRY